MANPSFQPYQKKTAEQLKTLAAETTAPKAASKASPASIMMAVLIAIIAGGSLWVSVSALMEKVRLSHGLQQIIDIMATTHEAVGRHLIDANASEDLLAKLGQMGNLRTTGEVNGIKTVFNPWNGMVVATAQDGYGRIETVLPTSICRRVLNLYDQNLRTLGVDQIEIRDARDAWEPLYDKDQRAGLSDEQIAAGCSNPRLTDIMLIYSLR